MECHVDRRQIEPNPKHEVQGCGSILQCFLIARDVTRDVNGFDISQKLFLGVKSRPDLENIRPPSGLPLPGQPKHMCLSNH